MSSQENQENIWKSNSAFLCFPSWEDYRGKRIQRRSLWHTDNTVPSRLIHLRNHNCTVTVEEAVGPNERGHDVGEGNLMRRNWGQNQKTSAEPRHEADKLGMHVEEKGIGTRRRWATPATELSCTKSKNQTRNKLDSDICVFHDQGQWKRKCQLMQHITKRCLTVRPRWYFKSNSGNCN